MLILPVTVTTSSLFLQESCWFILIGASLCFLNSFVLHSYPSTTTCSFSRAFLAIGPTMMYAAIVTKTIRILVIFHAKDVLSRQARISVLHTQKIVLAYHYQDWINKITSLVFRVDTTCLDWKKKNKIHHY